MAKNRGPILAHTRIIFPLLLLVPLFGGCQASPKKPTTAVPAEKSSESGGDFEWPAHAIRKSQQLVTAENLYRALAKVDRLQTRKGGETTVTIFDLLCEVNAVQEKLVCHGSTLPESTKRGQRVDFSSADSAKLFAELANLPIAKGDGGLTTEFVQCRHAKAAVLGGKEHYTCSVATPIQYVPHSSMPPMVEGED